MDISNGLYQYVLRWQKAQGMGAGGGWGISSRTSISAQRWVSSGTRDVTKGWEGWVQRGTASLPNVTFRGKPAKDAMLVVTANPYDCGCCAFRQRLAQKHSQEVLRNEGCDKRVGGATLLRQTEPLRGRPGKCATLAVAVRHATAPQKHN